MKYITRWSLMHSTRAESLSEHTCDTALLAHMLCLIARRYTGTPCRPKTVAVAALYHDAPEIITGDMPTPVKYSSPTLRDAYKALETESVRCMTGLLPDELSEELSPFISGELLTAEEKRLLKAADRLTIVKLENTGEFQASEGQVVEISASASPRPLALKVLTQASIDGNGTPALLNGRLAGLSVAYDKKTQTGLFIPCTPIF